MGKIVVARKVLYVENGIGYGGAVTCLRHLVRNLDRSRYAATVVTGHDGPLYADIARDAPWQPIIDRRVDVTALRRRLATNPWLCRLPWLHALLRQLVARLDDLVNLLPFMVALFRLALRDRPDLIHLNNEPLCNRGALLVAKLLRVPTVCHVRGDQQGSLSMAWLYRLPTHFITVSKWVSESIGRLGIPAEHRSVVYDGLELSHLDPAADGSAFRQTYGIPNDAFAVGLVGLLIPWKGQNDFLDAAKILRERIPNLKMLIVGGTPDECRDYEAKLRRRVTSEGLSEMVAFTGHVTDMPSAYNGLDVVVSASTAPEPLGTVVIEAMIMARPVIAPSHGGALEMATHDQTALLFAPGDARDLAEKVARVYNDPDTARRLGEAARASALASFNVETHAEKVQRIYDAVLGKH